MIKTGTQTVAVSAASANTILVGAIAAVLAAVAPSGTLADLAIKTVRAAKVSADIIAVLDFGRNDVTIVKHASAAVGAVGAPLSSASGVTTFNLIPDVTNANSAVFQLQRGPDSSDVLSTLVDPATPPSGALEIALAEALNPAASKNSVSQMIRTVESVLDALQMEGFLVLDTNAQTLVLHVLPDTSVVTAFQTEASTNALGSMPANSFVSKVHMEPAAASVTSTELI